MKRSQGKGDPHGPGLTVKKCSWDVEIDPGSGTIHPTPPPRAQVKRHRV